MCLNRLLKGFLMPIGISIRTNQQGYSYSLSCLEKLKDVNVTAFLLLDGF
jgi:hypothetical protein